MITGTVSGRLTADPVVRQGQNGNFTTFSVAVNHGKEKDQVTYVDCTANGKTGELVAEHFKKGNVFSGPAEFRMREYESNGQKRQSLSATVSMIDWQASQTEPKNQAAAPQAQPAQYGQPSYPAAPPAQGYGAPPAPGYGAPPVPAATLPLTQTDPFGNTYQLVNNQWVPVQQNRPAAPAPGPAAAPPTPGWGAPPAPGYGAGAPPAGQGPATPF